jgi:hypothetical protein
MYITISIKKGLVLVNRKWRVHLLISGNEESLVVCTILNYLSHDRFADSKSAVILIRIRLCYLF